MKELYPRDGTQPYTRMDLSDIELKLSVIDLGKDNEVSPPPHSCTASLTPPD